MGATHSEGGRFATDSFIFRIHRVNLTIIFILSLSQTGGFMTEQVIEKNQIEFPGIETANQDHPIPKTEFIITKGEGDNIFQYLLTRPISAVNTVRPLIEILQGLKLVDESVKEIDSKTLFLLESASGSEILTYLASQPYSEVYGMVRILQNLPIKTA